MRTDPRNDDRLKIQPGQIWLIEQTAADGVFTFEQDAFAGTDVVLYDRTLAALVRNLLPPAGYAEPLMAEAGESDPAISARALKLAADGWRVAQLMPPCRDWRKRLRRAGDQLGGAGSARIQLVAKTDAGPCRSREASLPDLPGLVDGLAEDERITLIVGPLCGGTPAAAWSVAGNGLAG